MSTDDGDMRCLVCQGRNFSIDLLKGTIRCDNCGALTSLPEAELRVGAEKSSKSVANDSKEKGNEIFFSYSTLDKKIAGPIANCLRDKKFNVFLAHEDIEISKEWRKTILAHLEKASFLVALLTPNYEKSVWTNQEAGFMIRKGTIMPLIVGKTDIKKFGFIELFQGIRIDEENLNYLWDGTISIYPHCLSKIVAEILKCIDKRR